MAHGCKAVLNSVEHSPSWKQSSSASKIPCVIWNLKVHYPHKLTNAQS